MCARLYDLWIVHSYLKSNKEIDKHQNEDGDDHLFDFTEHFTSPLDLELNLLICREEVSVEVVTGGTRVSAYDKL